mmetsp:Transcript_113047/g.243531  ORF Transcript_113047/g.243531 Transcript_113047/m.243531 type:complete len:151 (+) Transcript_113047:201-653(+)
MNIPILSAAMDTVTESELAIEMNRLGGIGVVHKNLSIDEQVAECLKVKHWAQSLSKEDLESKSHSNILFSKSDNLPITGAAIGIDDSSFVRSQKLIEQGLVNLLFLDTAHGDSGNVIKMLNRVKTWISNNNHKTEVVLGNIATEEAAVNL